MKVLLLGSGGRENALAWGLARSPSVSELIAAPGNPGMASLGELSDIDPTDVPAVLELTKRVGADLVVVGPEAPLVAGVGDALRAKGYRVFGPDKAAAEIEGSKSHAKSLMESAGIPTGAARSFTSVEAATEYMDQLGAPHVIKADGLAAGKGVIVTEDRAEAIGALQALLVDRRFGDAGASVLIEEYLDGPEVSLIAFCDGTNVVPCQPAQDYKRVFNNDQGLNTGGMGSYSPVPQCPPLIAAEITKGIIEPMVAETARRGAPFVGALYAGLALTSKGPRVIEFNARFGDPETQALIPRLKSDLGEVMLAAASGELAGVTLDWSDDVCITVVLASGGYPGSHETGRTISGLGEAEALDGVNVFHAGTALKDGELVTAGGRVLAVSATGASFKSARSLAYDAVRKIDFEGKHARTDIARRAEESEAAS